MENISRDLLSSLAVRLNHEHNLLLLGGSGFFGKSIVNFLIKLKVEYDIQINLTILSRNAKKFMKEYNLQRFNWIEFIDSDITDLKIDLNKYSRIIHAATPSHNIDDMSAKDRYEFILSSTNKIIEKLSKSNNILFISSGDVYADFSRKNAESSNINSSSDINMHAYSLAKVKSENLFINVSKDMGLSVKIARCFAFIGEYLPLDAHFAIGNFVKNCIDNRDIIINGDGKTIRSYMYQDDLAYWLLYLLYSDTANLITNVGSDDSISIFDLAKKVKLLTNSDSKIKVLNNQLENTRRFYVPDIKMARESYHLAPWTSLDQSIKKTYEYHKNIQKHNF